MYPQGNNLEVNEVKIEGLVLYSELNQEASINPHSRRCNKVNRKKELVKNLNIASTFKSKDLQVVKSMFRKEYEFMHCIYLKMAVSSKLLSQEETDHVKKTDNKDNMKLSGVTLIYRFSQRCECKVIHVVSLNSDLTTLGYKNYMIVIGLEKVLL